MKDFSEINDLVESVECRMQDAYEQGYETGHKDGEAKGIDKMNNLSKEAYTKGLEDALECARRVVLSSIFGGFTVDELSAIFDECNYNSVLKKYSASEAMQKIKEYEERQKQKCEFCFTEKLTKEKWASAKDCKKCKHFTDADEVHGYTPCGSCGADLHNFGPKQTDATDMNDRSIKVGDEVRIKGSDPVTDDCDYGVCTRSLPNINTMYVMRRDGSSGEENKDEWYRTGRFFPQIAEVLKLLRGDK